MNQESTLLNKDELTVCLNNGSTESIIGELLDQAQLLGHAQKVARNLVESALQLSLGKAISTVSLNKQDRNYYCNSNTMLADFRIEDTVFSISPGLPNEDTFSQLNTVFLNNDFELRILTRKSRLLAWRQLIESMDGIDSDRIDVNSVESFIGQIIFGLRGHSNGKHEQLLALFKIYNEKWNEQLGLPGISIVVE